MGVPFRAVQEMLSAFAIGRPFSHRLFAVCTTVVPDPMHLVPSPTNLFSSIAPKSVN